MKTRFVLLTCIVIFSMACSMSGLVPGQNPTPTRAAPNSENRCGDGVCDGPENAKNCPGDCSNPGQVTGEQTGSQTQEGSKPSDDTPQGSSAGSFIGQVYVDVLVNRQDGEGTCAAPPWGVDHIDGGDFSCPPPMYWFGQRLHATALQMVSIMPVSDGSWQITSNKPGGGTYQEVKMWSDGNRVCEPASAEGKPFSFSAEGGAADGKIALELSTRPMEIAQWTCDNNNSYTRETTLLLIDWAMAMTGDYTDLSLLLEKTDRHAPGFYRHIYTLDTNASPENRDHVEATVEFSCLKEVEKGVRETTPCPWE